MRKNTSFRFTTILTVLFLSFLVGLAVARGENGLSWSWLFASLLLAVATLKHQNITTLLVITLLGIVAGIIRGDAFARKLAPYEVLYGQSVVLEAKAEGDAVYGQSGQLDVDASNVSIIEPYRQDLPGKIKVQGYGTPVVYRGDILEVRGKLFPTGGSRQAKTSYSEIKVLGRSGLWSEKARREFVAGMQSAMPEPQASFGLGLLVGQRSTLPDEVSRQLSIVGLTHIIAVSGYNLTIIVRGVRRALSKRSKYQSTVIALALIGSFLLFTGFSASIVRASIVSLLSIAAWYYGRTFKPMVLITMAAALTAGWNPVYLWSDVGWYLSFLAFFGVLVVAPLLKRLVLGSRDPKFLEQVIFESISAQLMAAPLILYIFSEASLIALLSNAVIVPLVPFAMLLSLIGGVAGMIIPTVAGIIAWPGTALMTYILDLVSLFSRIPHAHVEYALPLGSMLLSYGLILSVALLLYRRLKLKHGTITEKNIIE